MSHLKNSIKAAVETLEGLEPLEPNLQAAADLVHGALVAGRKLLVCGNGGSASDSSHLATEFTCRFSEDRRPYPALSLTCDGSLLTAISNDYAFQDVFSRQVRAFGSAGDVLIVLTTSGKSRNILYAIEEARRLEMKSIALLGKGGGFIAGGADIELIVPSNVTARVQEAHKFLIHQICELVEDRLPKE